MDFISHLDVINPETNDLFQSHWTNTSASFQDPVSLTEQLQTTLDIEQLLSIFLHGISNSYKIMAIELDTYHGQFSTGLKTEEADQLSLPIRINDRLMGRLTYYSRKPITDIFLSSLSHFQKRLVFPLRNALAFWQLQQVALKDPLTAAGNRANYDDSLSRAIVSAQRNNKPFVLMILDLDNFKQVNDRFGHQTGDHLLISFVTIVNQCLRGNDQLFRFGGDEFAIILEQDNLESAQVVTERLQQEILKSEINSVYKVGVSLGCTLWSKQDSSDTLFARADSALYEAKRAGKNCLKTA